MVFQFASLILVEMNSGNHPFLPKTLHKRNVLGAKTPRWRGAGALRKLIWTIIVKLGKQSFCTFRDVASAGPPKYQEYVRLEHRFCTSHAKDAKCKTYALDCGFLGILEALSLIPI